MSFAARHTVNFAALILTLSAVFVLTACSSSTVSDVDPTADFSGFQTYAFLSDVAEDKSAYQSLERTHLKNAVGQAMNSRGYRRDDNDPDLLINFAVETEEKLQTRTVPNSAYGIGYDPFFDVYTTGWGMSHSTTIDQYTEGRLEVDVIDVDARKAIWQGTTKGRLTQKAMENYQATLNEAVNEIFSQFPVTP